MEKLHEYFQRKLNSTPTDFFRYMFHNIKWQGRAFGIVGPRGVGKSTMLLQYIKLNLDTSDTLYVSADNVYFSTNSLIDLADNFVKMGGKHLFIDEIHKYPDWSRQLKHIYDGYSDLQIVISGSSILDIYRGMSDLSRRIPMYEMQGLSFREYLALFYGIKAPVAPFDDIVGNRVPLPVEHPLPLFRDYLRRGYYPFGRDEEFDIELMQVINQTMETDIPQFLALNASMGHKLKNLLMVVAQNVPFKPVVQHIADSTGISRNNIPDYFLNMERAGMIAQLRDDTIGLRGLGKVEKMYLDNTNLVYALAPTDANLGNVKETFFMNQMRVNHKVLASRISDFTIDNRTFEIGGKKKGNKQIADATEGYVVKDDIEYGFANVIPLWAFGMNH